MNGKKSLITALFLFVNIIIVFSQNPTSYYWELNSLEQIAGNTLSYTGSPTIEDTDIGKAMRFDAKDNERILIDANPIADAKEFTVEVVFKADSGIENQTNEPRFVHIQDPDDSKDKRVMMEIRVNKSDKFYLDGFMNTDTDNLTLIDATKTHAIDDWIHAAITFKDNILTTYVNGVEELSGTVSYASQIINSTGKTSLGARMNEKNYYSGLIKCLKVTHAKLSPSQFIDIDTMKIGGTPDPVPVPDPEPLNISVQQQKDKMFVYPMPANNYITIQFLESTYVLNIDLINVSGISVNHLSLMRECNEGVEINVADLKSGIYFLKINTNSGYLVKQVSIRR